MLYNFPYMFNLNYYKNIFPRFFTFSLVFYIFAYKFDYIHIISRKMKIDAFEINSSSINFTYESIDILD